MFHYPHFAFKNVYLLNGYAEEVTPEGTVYFFSNEENLENTLRLLLIQKRTALTGWELRFLRRGLKYSQTELAQYLDKDVQTVARIEKSNETISQPNDLMIRALYSDKFNLGFKASDLLSFISGQDSVQDYKIYLSFSGVWTYSFTYQFKTKRYHEEFEISLPISERESGPRYFIRGASRPKSIKLSRPYNPVDDDSSMIQASPFRTRTDKRETPSYRYH